MNIDYIDYIDRAYSKRKEIITEIMILYDINTCSKIYHALYVDAYTFSMILKLQTNLCICDIRLLNHNIVRKMWTIRIHRIYCTFRTIGKGGISSDHTRIIVTIFQTIHTDMAVGFRYNHNSIDKNFSWAYLWQLFSWYLFFHSSKFCAFYVSCSVFFSWTHSRLLKYVCQNGRQSYK